VTAFPAQRFAGFELGDCASGDFLHRSGSGGDLRLGHIRQGRQGRMHPAIRRGVRKQRVRDARDDRLADL
jgi:hypothetical protein